MMQIVEPALRPATTEGLMRVGPLVEIPNVLQSFGANPNELLSGLDISVDTLSGSDNLIRLRTLGALLLRCSERTGCPHFGLLVGQRAKSEHYGLVGALMRNAPSLGTAISDWASNQHRFVRGSVITLLDHDDVRIMTYRIHQSGIIGIDQIVDTAAAAGNAILQALSGQAPVEVWLPRTPPQDPRVYREVFGVKPRYDVSVAGLAYSYQALAQPISGADPAKRQQLEAEVRDYRVTGLPTIVDQVRRQLGARITAGNAGKVEIARELGIHEREMSRRLIEAGTTFRSLANEARFEVACQLLANTDLTIAKIAEALGYSGASGFVNAFGKIANVSPLAWRESAQKTMALRASAE